MSNKLQDQSTDQNQPTLSINTIYNSTNLKKKNNFLLEKKNNISIFTNIQKAIDNLQSSNFLTAKEIKNPDPNKKSYYKYYLFPNFEHFLKYFQKLKPPERRFHQVQTSKTRLYHYDIELETQDHIQSDLIPELNLENFDKCIKIIIQKTLQYFQQDIPYYVANNHRVIETTPNLNYKYSTRIVFHITTPFKDPKIIIDQLFKNEDPNIYNMIDKGIYRSISNMRLPYNIKLSSPSNPMLPALMINIDHKIMNNTDHNFNEIKNYLTNPKFHPTLPHHSLPSTPIIENTKPVFDPNLEEKIEKWLIKNNLNDVYSIHIDKFIRLERMLPALCPICNHIHDNDNAYITISNNSCYFKCFRDPHKRYIKICSHKKLKIPKHIIYKNIQQCAKIQNTNPKNIKTQKIYYPSIQSNIYNFEKYNTIFCRSATGTSKTQALLQHIQSNDYKNILFITHRIALANELSQYLPDFTNYRNCKDRIIKDNKVICQIDSLLRVDMNDIDLLILDEAESLFDELCKYSIKKPLFISKKLKYMISSTKKLLVMDAHIDTNRLFDLIVPLRHHVQTFEPLFIDNLYKSKTQHICNIYTREEEWINMLLYDIMQNKKLIIPTNSKDKAEQIKNKIDRFILENYPDRNSNCKIYTGDMSTDDRKNLSNINEEWSKYNHVVYTPCISAGNSFTEDHFDKVYAYFINTSANYLQCLQMLYRSRNITENTFEIMIEESNFKNLPVDINEIHKMNELKYHEFLKSYNGVPIEFNSSGMTIEKEDWYYQIILHHQVIENMNKTEFLFNFLKWINYYGSQVNIIDTIDSKYRTSSNYLQNCDIKRDKKISKDTKINILLKSKDIDLEYYNQLCASENKSENDKLMIEKKGIKLFYNLDNLDEKETEILLNKYNKPRIKNIYLHLKDLKTIDYQHYPDLEQLSTLKDETSSLTLFRFEEKNNRYLHHIEISKLLHYITEGDTLNCVYDRQEIINNVIKYITPDKLKYLISLFNIDGRYISPKLKISNWRDVSSLVNSMIYLWDIKIKLRGRSKSQSQEVIFEKINLFNSNPSPILK